LASSGGVVTDNTIVQAMLRTCADAYPSPLSVQALFDAVSGDFEDAEARAAGLDMACRFIARAFAVGIIELHWDAPPFANHAGLRPLASPLARLQAERGESRVTSLRPSMVRLDSQLGLELVKLLDGKRDRAALLQALVERMQEFAVVGADGKESIQTSEWWQDHLAGQLESGLQLACKMALLDA